MRYDRTNAYILSCNERVRSDRVASAAADSEYLDGDEWLYLFGKTADGEPTRVVASAGFLGEHFGVGTEHLLVADQTSRAMGYAFVVGIVTPTSREGNVTYKRLPLSVFK